MERASEKKIPCPNCGKLFWDAEGQVQHAKAKKHKPVYIPEPSRPHPDSMAELFIQGEINRAMGEANPDWLEDMLP